MKKIAIITLHGQGTYKETAHEKMIGNILDRLDVNKSQIEVFSVMYYSQIQKNQDAFMLRMGKISSFMLSRMREKLISSFGDPATIYYNKPAYQETMLKVKEQFIKANNFIGSDGHIIILAHSLGGPIISNFLWDAEKAGVKYSRIKLLVTTGCPIPFFVSGIKIDNIMTIKKPSFNFKWFNFWNKKDILSFPLRRVNMAYKMLVTDFRVKKGMYILAHGSYDSDIKGVIKPIVYEIDNIIND